MDKISKSRRISLALILLAVWVITYFPINYWVAKRQSFFDGYVFDFERNLEVQPGFVILYLLVYLLIPLPFFFFKNKDLLYRLLAGEIFIIVFSAIIFLLYPLEIQRPLIIEGGHCNNLLKFIYWLDPPHNLFPSLHISIIFFTVFATFLANKKMALLLSILACLIALSTLYTKQHYLTDVISGFILALGSFLILFRQIIFGRN